MIKNKELIADKKMLFDNLEKSSIDFYPCGSRYFGFHKKDSDYDFFASMTVGFVQLEDLGFTLSERTVEYGELDANTDSIWFKYLKDIKIHIMLVKDVNSRLYIQDLIRKSNQPPTKGDTSWWNNQYKQYYK